MLFCTLLLSSLGVFAKQPATNLTPESAMAIALSDNRDLIAARFAIRQAEGRLKQAGLLPNPEFEASHQNDSAFANEGEYTVSAGFKQRFPITGRLSKAKAVARVDVAQAMAEVRNQERILAGEVLARSRELLVVRDKLKAKKEIQDIIQKLIDVSEKRLKAGEISATDVNLAKIELQKVTLEQATLLNQQETAENELNRLLGRGPATPVQMSGVAGVEIDANISAETLRQALAQRPDRQLAALSVDRAEAEIKLARAEKWEDWTVGFDYNHDNSKFVEPVGNKVDNFLGISASIPLPLWNRNQGNISEAEATRQRAEAELRALDLRIATEVQTAKDQTQRLSKTLRQYREESLKLADENIVLLQKGYADGLVNITTIIQAQQQLSELRQGYLETLGEYLDALTNWQTATGSILSNPTRN